VPRRPLFVKDSGPRSFPQPSAVHSRALEVLMSRTVVLPLLLLALAAFCLSSPAMAQDSAHGKWVSDPAGLATPGFVYDQPPAGFDPLTASELELEQYGFPPRPPQSDRAHYASWKRAATATRFTPQLTPTNIYNGPARIVKIGPGVRTANQGPVFSANSQNWSGFVLDGANGTFTKNGSEIIEQWYVPHATQAPGTCNSTWDYSFEWVGFDGWTASDVLQAGTEADANCSSTLYSFWYEWYPFSETRISFTISPGDDVEVEVWYTTTSPFGHAQWFNATTAKATSVGFNPPSGTTYLGNSAEWIVERPTVSGALSDLANVNETFLDGYAYNGTTFYYPGSAGTLNTYDVTMVCPPWNPSSSCTTTTTLMFVDLFAISTLYFGDSGPAY
jgi:hypothetical protein